MCPCVADRIEFGSVGKTGVPKPTGRTIKGENQQQTQPHMATMPGLEPGPHRSESQRGLGLRGSGLKIAGLRGSGPK